MCVKRLLILAIILSLPVLLAAGKKQMPGDYPPPGGEFVRSTPNIDGTEESWFYTSSKYQNEVAAYYTSLFRQEGFKVALFHMQEPIGKSPATSIGAHKKGLNIVILLSVDRYNPGLVSVHVRKIYGSQAGLPPITMQLPKNDVPGEDLKIVARPPDSIRIDYSKEGCGEGKSCQNAGSYVSRLSSLQLRDFYLKNLVSLKIDKIITSGSSYIISSNTNYGRLTIIITPNTFYGDRPSGSVVNIMLMSK
jgi:hypothetical protein